MKFDYDYFTKTELVSFLNKYGEDFKYSLKPHHVMMEERQKKIFAELDELHIENGLLIEKLITAPTSQKIAISRELDKGHKKWQSLHDQLDKLYDLSYGVTK